MAFLMSISTDRITQFLGWLILVVFIASLTALVVLGWNNESFRGLLIKNFQVIVLLPVTALFSFVLIALFQTIAGKVEFEIFGLKFSGASGPTIMWILAFSVISTAIQIMWVP